MTKRILITGGAGFIGSHVAQELLEKNYRVRVLDSLVSQVHGDEGVWPDYLPAEVERQQGDVRDMEAVEKALQSVDAVIHLAARVGVGQSMYEVVGYTDANQMGSAVLHEALSRRPVERLVVASSMSIYGEGRYRDEDGNFHDSVDRSPIALERGGWEPMDEQGRPLTPVPTPETKPPDLTSNYALGKFAQEQMAHILGRAYDIPTVALRFFNVYGPRQALSNPYTGVLAIFASRLLNKKAPIVYEDGGQRRDFVHVRDVALACRLALESQDAARETVNVGSGNIRTVLGVWNSLTSALNQEGLEPELTGQWRKGDIRHCYADLTKAREVLGFEAQIDWDTGLAEYAEWLVEQTAFDHIDAAHSELKRRGLAV